MGVGGAAILQMHQSWCNFFSFFLCVCVQNKILKFYAVTIAFAENEKINCQQKNALNNMQLLEQTFNPPRTRRVLFNPNIFGDGFISVLNQKKKKKIIYIVNKTK